MDLKDCTIDTKQVFGPMVIQYYQIDHVYAGYIPLNLEITHLKGSGRPSQHLWQNSLLIKYGCSIFMRQTEVFHSRKP